MTKIVTEREYHRSVSISYGLIPTPFSAWKLRVFNLLRFNDQIHRGVGQMESEPKDKSVDPSPDRTTGGGNLVLG